MVGKAPGLTAQLKEKLIQQGIERRLRRSTAPPPAPLFGAGAAAVPEVPEQYYRFDLHPGYQQLRIMTDGAARLGIGSPFFKVHEGRDRKSVV